MKNISWMKYKNYYFVFSGVLILISLFSLINYKLKIGLEFRGGTEVTYKTNANLDEFSDANIQNLREGKYIFKFEEVSTERRAEILSKLKAQDESSEELNYQLVGPAIGEELVRKTIYASLISAAAILLWVAFQFKSLKYGLAAILAMLHDSIILFGSFALLGKYFGAEADFLFVTAVLTTLTFSVHDTIVVFDRIREVGKSGSKSMEELASHAVKETMRRSIINSLTIIFMLASLVIFGGLSIRWFATALLIGAVTGTYSSPFIAVPLLVVLDKFKKK